MREDKKWTEHCTVRSYDLDIHQHVSIRSICNFLQEAAGHHAGAFGFSVPQLLHRNRTWVMSRLHIHMDRLPGWDDEITIQTWPSGSRKLLALRDFAFFVGQERVGSASSAWLMVDTSSRRIVRFDDSIDYLEHVHPERALDTAFEKLPSVGERKHGEQFRVRFGDLDMNIHVNFATNVDWLLEGTPFDVREDFLPREVEANFLAEAHYGDRLTSFSSPVSGNRTAFLHSLVREEDGKEIARGRTAWEPIQAEVSNFLSKSP